ncbi:unnamed protein product [Toxocara canis]|uniref:Dimer_Tnp_hAT domain-containing protein n=1 Tax=Toxocara canis TaxID=6265 RepID=A0A183VCV2_TOXCA|nr:unnamed protein product [Toxocara canis]
MRTEHASRPVQKLGKPVMLKANSEKGVFHANSSCCQQAACSLFSSSEISWTETWDTIETAGVEAIPEVAVEAGVAIETAVEVEAEVVVVSDVAEAVDMNDPAAETVSVIMAEEGSTFAKDFYHKSAVIGNRSHSSDREMDTLKKCWRPLKENPNDFDAWTRLLQCVEQLVCL